MIVDKRPMIINHQSYNIFMCSVKYIQQPETDVDRGHVKLFI